MSITVACYSKLYSTQSLIKLLKYFIKHLIDDKIFYLIDLFKYNKSFLVNAFYELCINLHVNYVEYMLYNHQSLLTTQTQYSRNTILCETFIKKLINVTNFNRTIIENKYCTLIELLFKYFPNNTKNAIASLNDSIKLACQFNYLYVLKTFSNYCNLTNKYRYIFDIMMVAIQYGSIEITKWLLLSYPTFIIDYSSSVSVCIICQLNSDIVALKHFQMAIWLHSINPQIYIMINSCYWNRALINLINISKCFNIIDIIKWILDTNPEIFSDFNNNDWNRIFVDACLNANVGVAKYLLQLIPDINIAYLNDEAFNMAIRNVCIPIINMFIELNSYKYIVVFDENNKIKSYKINKNIIPINNNIIKINKEECIICYDVLEEIITNCGHSFCYDCINKYYLTDRNKDKCPYCRQNMTHFIKIN